MNQFTVQTEVLNKIQDLNQEQLQDVMAYIGKVKPAPLSRENYRRKAIREIRTALQNL